MQVYPNRFEQELKQGLKPCYLLFGDEPQQKFTMIEAVRSQASHAGFAERTVLVADKDFSWNQLLEATQTLSLFSSQQLIELELPTGKPGTEGSKILQSVASTLADDVLLLIHGPRIGKDVQKAKWFKALDSIGIHAICYPLEGQPLINWLQQQLSNAGLTADNAGIRLIADLCEGNMLAASQEIRKLALLYPGQSLTTENIEKALIDQSRFNVFQLVDVMLAGEQQRSIKMLYRLESEGVEPNILIWAFIREWQTLSQLRETLDAGNTIQWQRFGIWKNRQSAYQSALSRLSTAHLKKLRHALETADLAFKQNSQVKPYISLAHLCMMFLAIPLDSLPLPQN